MSQEQLAEAIGVSVRHVSFLETGRTFISSDLLQRIAEKLNVSFNAFFYDETWNAVDANWFGKVENIIDSAMKSAKSQIREREFANDGEV